MFKSSAGQNKICVCGGRGTWLFNILFLYQGMIRNLEILVIQLLEIQICDKEFRKCYTICILNIVHLLKVVFYFVVFLFTSRPRRTHGNLGILDKGFIIHSWTTLADAIAVWKKFPMPN